MDPEKKSQWRTKYDFSLAKTAKLAGEEGAKQVRFTSPRAQNSSTV